MMDLRELYQEVIIDHNNNPRNHFEMKEPTSMAKGFNPVCGDKVTIYLKIDKGLVKEVSFIGSGCAISQASASLMTEALVGKTLSEAQDLFENFHQLLTKNDYQPKVNLDKLIALSGVKTFPARVKCATLPWHTFEACLHKDKQVVTTE